MINKTTVKSGKPRRIHSMHFEIAVTVAVSAVLALVMALGVVLLGRVYVSSILHDKDKRTQLRSEKLEDFADFVYQNGITSDDGDAINGWLNSQDTDVYLTIYRTDCKLLHDNGGYFRYEYDETEKQPSESDTEKQSDYDSTVYPVKFADGVYSVSIAVSTRTKYYAMLIVLAFIIYEAVIVLCITLYSRYTIKKIKSLSQQTFVISRGDIEKEVELKCGNELSELAQDIDTMRVSLVERLNGEKKAWQANQELITSISHDIRNPLTTLVAYSEILANGQYDSKEQLEQYVNTCRDKAYQLKKLTDELFSYSLVFGEQELKPEIKAEDAAIVLGQMLGEQIAELGIKGCVVKSKMLTKECGYISIDVNYLKRVVDNIFSNINKYADLEKAVTVSVKATDSTVNAEFKNYILENTEQVESSKIGLKTCERLCASMGIIFRYYESSGVFYVEMSMPLSGNE